MITDESRTNMIKQQLRTGDVLSEEILQLYEQIKREDFVPEPMKNFAYTDMQIPLIHEQCMLTPLEEGQILTALGLHGNESVLEIGTGTGFFTALLATLSKEVTSVDYYSDFTRLASNNLRNEGIENVNCITGDAYNGWMDGAPYDVVVFTGAIDAVTEGHRLQVLPGGKLFAIHGSAPVMQGTLYTLDHDENWSEALIFETCVPPLINTLKPKNFVF